MAKILLVEDDAFIAEIYEKKLTSAGFAVDNVASGREALKRLSLPGYDLVLLDLVLPEMNGLDVLREVKEKPAEYDHHAKIVIFSNLSSPNDREQAIHAGADGFISKTDFTPSETVEEVERLLRQFGEQAKNEMRNNGVNATAVAAPTPVSSAESKKILLIEDEEVFAEMFGKRLSDEGYAITHEVNGRQALERALAESFDLILTDAILPGLDGRDIARELRQHETTRDVPVFLLSASLLDDELQALDDSQAVTRSFLKTRITPSELADAVNAYFKQSQKK